MLTPDRRTIHQSTKRGDKTTPDSRGPVLEPAAQAFAEATASPPYLFDLPVGEGRKTVDATQDGDFPDPAATVFTSYALSPEARYPVAIEQIYTVPEWIANDGAAHDVDPERIAVAGDSVGGNMTAAITLMASQRGGPRLAGQLLYYPVTDASFDTGSYHQFATGYWLRRDAMQWFWDQYTTDPAQRAEITASPLRATPDDLAGLPRALVINGEADVLRDEKA